MAYKHNNPKRPAPDNRVDFNRLRRRRRRATTARRLLLLAGVMLLVLGALFLNNILVEQSVTTRLSDVVQGFGGTGYPIPVPGGIIRGVQGAGNDLAVLNDTNLYIYSRKGKQVGNVQQMSDNTVLIATPSRLLTYEANAKRFSVHSRSKTLLQMDTEYNIFAADMNDHGDIAIVSSAKKSICEITVYNKKFEDIYGYSFANNLVSTVSLSPRGEMMATGWVNAEDGVLQSGVEIHLFAEGTGVIASCLLPDSLILDVQFLEQDRVAVLTDRQYLILGTDGTIRYTYNLEEELTAVERAGRLTLLLCEERETQTRKVILLDSELKEKAVIVTADKVLDFALSSKRVYLLGEDGIRTYDHTFTEQAFEPVQHAWRIQLAGGKLYYLTREQICVLGQTEKEEAPSGESAPASGADASVEGL